MEISWKNFENSFLDQEKPGKNFENFFWKNSENIFETNKLRKILKNIRGRWGKFINGAHS